MKLEIVGSSPDSQEQSPDLETLFQEFNTEKVESEFISKRTTLTQTTRLTPDLLEQDKWKLAGRFMTLAKEDIVLKQVALVINMILTHNNRFPAIHKKTLDDAFRNDLNFEKKPIFSRKKSKTGISDYAFLLQQLTGKFKILKEVTKGEDQVTVYEVVHTEILKHLTGNHDEQKQASLEFAGLGKGLAGGLAPALAEGALEVRGKKQEVKGKNLEVRNERSEEGFESAGFSHIESVPSLTASLAQDGAVPETKRSWEGIEF